MTKTFQQRLTAVMSGGNLTIADLTRWFDRPHATVLQWKQGTKPGRSPADILSAYGRLEILEKLIETRKAVGKPPKQLPVPALTLNERIDYLADMRRAMGF